MSGDDGYVTDTITIRRVLTPDSDDQVWSHVDGDSGLTMHLGMLTLTHDTLIRETMDEDDQ